MALWKDLIEPADLTVFARRTQRERELAEGTLAAFFPTDYVDGDVAKYTITEQGLASTAEYRSYDAESTIGGADKGQRVTLELPPLSRKSRIGELDQMRSRMPSRDLSDAQLDVAGRQITNNVDAMFDRLEALRGSVLNTGRVTIQENGFYADVDLQRKDDMNVTPGTAWDQSGSDPVQDYLAWAETYNDENGSYPAAALTSRKALMGLLKNETLIKMIGGSAVRSILTVDELDTLFGSFGLPPLVPYDRKVNVGGTIQRVLPEDKLFLLPAAGTIELGQTVFGRTVEADDPEYAIPFADAPGMVASLHKEWDPHGYWARVNAIALPVMTNPNSSMVASILTT